MRRRSSCKRWLVAGLLGLGPFFILWFLLSEQPGEIDREPARAPLPQAGLAADVVRAEPKPLPDFPAWVERFLSSTQPSPELEGEGVRLASERRARLLELIETDPAEVVASALPAWVRVRLPESVQALVEERINAVGELAVYGAIDEQGHGQTFRVARFEGRELRAFVYGRRAEEISRPIAYLDGVALAGKLAVRDQPLRELAPEEWTRPGAAAGLALNLPPCAYENHLITNQDPVAVLAGGAVRLLCTHEHLEAFSEDLWQLEADGAGGGLPSRTEGSKRAILVRVDFSDLVGEPFSMERASGLITEVNDFYFDCSYGRAGLTLVGEGTDVTPVLRMPNTAAYYGTNDRYNDLRIHARAAAIAAGFVLGAYDFDVVCMGRVPGFTWAGLGYVGGTGAWIRNTSASGVLAHELGHNLGLNHANFWETHGESVAGAGTSTEYGDIFDTMGTASGGVRHFNARYKNLLNWIRPDEFANVTNSGSFRIFALDDPASGRLRALRIVKDVSRNYWVEFRQRLASNRWSMAGAGLRFAGNGNQRSDLLDTTPGSPEGRNDSPLVVGRTYSDYSAGVHITPIALGQTTPKSLDVIVRLGSFPGNRPPTLSISAPRMVVAPGQWLEFSANASDSDGDALAYYWDFGDGAFGTNGPAAAHRWFDHGQRVVQCTVSDMKGGRYIDSLLITVGTPAQFSISGRVSKGGHPVEGARVFVSSSEVAYTDSGGRYRLVNLSAGSFMVAASVEAERSVPLGFANPVLVGPDAENVDFVLGNPAEFTAISLVSTGSVWRYFTSRTNLVSDWTSAVYQDAFWSEGQAQLGYGDGDEKTLLDFGPDAGDKPITTYFRREFEAEKPSDFARVELGLLRDDGAVVYLNEREVFRSNMPDGLVSAGTRAIESVGGSEERTFYVVTLDSAALVPGRNLLAVEVHQSTPTSTDLSFDLRLRGIIATNQLIPTGSIWRYASAVPADWRELSFEDGPWPSGPAQLGYGDGDEATVLDYGGNPENKRITAYLRRVFTVSPDTQIGALKLGLLVDDGAVVYLNGQEIRRSNLPANEIGAGTHALVAVAGADESRFVEAAVDPSLIRPGPNVIAAEVHQSSPGSSDLSFDFYLTSSAVRELRGELQLVSPLHNSHSPLGSNVILRAQVSALYGEQIESVAFYDGPQYVGHTRQPPYSLVWNQPAPGLHSLSAFATNASGNVLVALPVALSVEPSAVAVTLLPAKAVWRYLDDGSNPGPDWAQTHFQDDAWAAGVARFGYGGDGEVTLLSFGGDPSRKQITTYFRTWFDWTDANPVNTLRLLLQRDDGAVVYLNGVEALRSNMPEDPVGPETLASSAVSGASEQGWFETQLSPDWLAPGANVVAVELHQANATSSDLGFDLELSAVRIPLDVPLLLRWERLNKDQLRLSWPIWMDGQLHSSSQARAGWAPVSSGITITNGIRSLLINSAEPARFYELRR